LPDTQSRSSCFKELALKVILALVQGQGTATVTPSQWKRSWIFVTDRMFFFLLGLESSLYLQIYPFESSLAEIMYLPFAAEQAEIWLLVFWNPEKWQ
jgi:hypothetical protein